MAEVMPSNSAGSSSVIQIDSGMSSAVRIAFGPSNRSASSGP